MKATHSLLFDLYRIDSITVCGWLLQELIVFPISEEDCFREFCPKIRVGQTVLKCSIFSFIWQYCFLLLWF